MMYYLCGLCWYTAVGKTSRTESKGDGAGAVHPGGRVGQNVRDALLLHTVTSKEMFCMEGSIRATNIPQVFVHLNHITYDSSLHTYDSSLHAYDSSTNIPSLCWRLQFSCPCAVPIYMPTALVDDTKLYCCNG